MIYTYIIDHDILLRCRTKYVTSLNFNVNADYCFDIYVGF